MKARKRKAAEEETKDSSSSDSSSSSSESSYPIDKKGRTSIAQPTTFYTVTDKLGEGSSAKVYLALVKQNAELSDEEAPKCALKVFKHPKYFDDEKNAFAALHDVPHVIKPMGTVAYDPNNGDDTIILPYLECGDVYHNIICAGKRLSFSQTKTLAEQVLQSLKAMHDKKWIHGDLTTNNISFHNDKLTIFDLGLAEEENKFVRDADRTITTWCYRAPEVFWQRMGDRKEYGCEADMWSLGCILFEVYYGCPLFPTIRQSTKEDVVNTLNMLGRNIRKEDYEEFPDFLVGCGTLDRDEGGWKDEMRQAANANGDTKEQIESLIDLISGMLQFYPRDRISAADALELPIFKALVNSSASEFKQDLNPSPGFSSPSRSLH